MTAKRTQSAIAPLTRISKGTGKVYTRPQKVHEQIEAVMGWPLQKAFELAAAGKLYPQTVAHLMRNFKPNRQSPQYDAVVLAFFTRLERAGDAIIRDLTDTQKDWVRGEVFTKVTEWLRDSRMDIFEVSFRKAAERLFLTALAKVRRRTEPEVSPDDLVTPGPEATGEEALDAALVRSGSIKLLVEFKAELKEALARLTDKERLAVAYVEVLGLTETEAGERLGCTDRNVRHLIKKARDKTRDLAMPVRGSAGRKE